MPPRSWRRGFEEETGQFSPRFQVAPAVGLGITLAVSFVAAHPAIKWPLTAILAVLAGLPLDSWLDDEWTDFSFGPTMLADYDAAKQAGRVSVPEDWTPEAFADPLNLLSWAAEYQPMDAVTYQIVDRYGPGGFIGTEVMASNRERCHPNACEPFRYYFKLASSRDVPAGFSDFGGGGS